MKKYIAFSILFILISIFSCNSTSNKSEAKNSVEKIENITDEFFITFTIDGKEVNIPIDEVSTSYNVALKKPVFKIMAGEYGKINLLLITTEDITKPSSTPSGSTNFDDEITQGSVSLQNYPLKNYTSNSYNMGDEKSKVISPNAIVITKSERVADKYRIIEGKINVKVFGGDPGTDKNVSDHIIIGKFRVKHEFTDVKF
jgi:hypothetical protein